MEGFPISPFADVINNSLSYYISNKLVAKLSSLKSNFWVDNFGMAKLILSDIPSRAKHPIFRADKNENSEVDFSSVQDTLLRWGVYQIVSEVKFQKIGLHYPKRQLAIKLLAQVDKNPLLLVPLLLHKTGLLPKLQERNESIWTGGLGLAYCLRLGHDPQLAQKHWPYLIGYFWLIVVHRRIDWTNKCQ